MKIIMIDDYTLNFIFKRNSLIISYPFILKDFMIENIYACCLDIEDLGKESGPYLTISELISHIDVNKKYLSYYNDHYVLITKTDQRSITIHSLKKDVLKKGVEIIE